MDTNLIDKLWNKTVVDKDTGCWIWKGKYLFTRGERTYGYITINRANKLVHRLSLCIYLKLEYSNNLWQACHLCKNKECWNPLHLYVGTEKTNANDRYVDRTHCKYGHLRSEENTYINSTGTRGCKVCRNEYNRKNWKKYTKKR